MTMPSSSATWLEEGAAKEVRRRGEEGEAPPDSASSSPSTPSSATITTTTTTTTDDLAPAATGGGGGSGGEIEAPSKSRLKKLRRRERILAKKAERKARERDAKKKEKRHLGDDLLAPGVGQQQQQQQLAAGERGADAASKAEAEAAASKAEAGSRAQEERRCDRRQRIWDEEKLPLAAASFRICVDCSFEPRMTEREVAGLAKQLRYCYSVNWKSPNPCLWTATDLPAGKSQILAHLQGEVGFETWRRRGFTTSAKPLEVLYGDRLDDVVYLTGDSDEALTDLDDRNVYVIGGIVDRNRLKGAALRRAESLKGGGGAVGGVKTARLPIAEHLDGGKMNSTPILACNHVFEILLKYREFGNDWGRALDAVLPRRKGARFVKKREEEKRTTAAAAAGKEANGGPKTSGVK